MTALCVMRRMTALMVLLIVPALTGIVLAQPQVVTIEGRFGKAEVDVTAPSLVRLHLRGPNGSTQQSVIAPSGSRPWAHGGYTYLIGRDDRRYESRSAKPDKVKVSEEGGRTVLRIAGVKLAASGGEEPVATEQWMVSAPGDGTQLIWKITRQWKKDFVSVMSGSPGLFFCFNAHTLNSSVTSTLWYDPLRLDSAPSPRYASLELPEVPAGSVSQNLVQTVKDRDTWAIYKLWTNWRAPADLRLKVKGGHLYRRGGFAWLSEAGAITDRNAVRTYRKGQSEEITLSISAVDKGVTGYQLAVTLPDKVTEASLKDFYGSLLNGGAINDQKGFDFGNESDGWYYGGSSWTYGTALAAGIPANGRLSSYPYDAAQAFREHLAHILSVLDQQGRAHFGYNQTGDCVDDNLHTISGTRAYLLHSGDLAFVRQILPALERMLQYFIERRNDRGLFKLADDGAHWYYDAIITGGINGYYNAFFYKAANDLAEMEQAAGRQDKAETYRAIAQQIKRSFNEMLWKEDAPGGPRYLDWIDAKGKEVSYFCDLCQWPPIAVGIASPEQARKVVATADARIAQLEKEHGYRGFACLSALWPAPNELLTYEPERVYGNYMNGGSLLCQTYWEIVARSRAGDNEGAARRLTLFARRAAETSWAGNNTANIRGEIEPGGTEPYLADMVVVPASVIHGLMGITPTWDRLEVTPRLPAAWTRAEANVLYKGRRHRVTINGQQVTIHPLEQVIALPLQWVMDFNLRTAPGGAATISNVDFLEPYGSSVTLVKSAASGTYQSPPYDWAVPVGLAELTVAADLHGGRVTAMVETSNDAFKTVLPSGPIPLRDGVNAYPLDTTATPVRMVRVRFELVRGPDATTTPAIDGFRLVGPAKE